MTSSETMTAPQNGVNVVLIGADEGKEAQVRKRACELQLKRTDSGMRRENLALCKRSCGQRVLGK